jgi:hypothetical protein
MEFEATYTLNSVGKWESLMNVNEKPACLSTGSFDGHSVDGKTAQLLQQG